MYKQRTDPFDPTAADAARAAARGTLEQYWEDELLSGLQRDTRDTRRRKLRAAWDLVQEKYPELVISEGEVKRDYPDTAFRGRRDRVPPLQLYV